MRSWRAAKRNEPVLSADIRGLRLAAPQTLVLDGIDEIVGAHL